MLFKKSTCVSTLRNILYIYIYIHIIYYYIHVYIYILLLLIIIIIIFIIYINKHVPCNNVHLGRARNSNMVHVPSSSRTSATMGIQPANLTGFWCSKNAGSTLGMSGNFWEKKNMFFFPHPKTGRLGENLGDPIFDVWVWNAGENPPLCNMMIKQWC